MKKLFTKDKNTIITIVSGIIIILILLAIPTGFEDAIIYQGTERTVATVLETDNSAIVVSGLIQSGEQSCVLSVDEGIFEGREITGVNFLSGSLEKDKVFEVGDKAMVVISYSGDDISSVTMTDHYRLGNEVILAVIFAVFLIIFAGKNGIQAILSFIITIMTIWKILVPNYLKGYNPIWIGIAITILLTAIIIFFVYGVDKRTIVAVSGSLLGIITTCILGIIFTNTFKIHGAVMSGAESLLYTGLDNLDLTSIFMSGIFIGASGAMMDLSVDITSAVHEVVLKKPEIGRLEAMKSGFNMGRAAMGTMTTTLLLAYSGGYIAQLMVFMAQGTPIDNILNYKYVASEILDTVVGSFGLVTVAPFTASVAAFMLTNKKKENYK